MQVPNTSTTAAYTGIVKNEPQQEPHIHAEACTRLLPACNGKLKLAILVSDNLILSLSYAREDLRTAPPAPPAPLHHRSCSHTALQPSSWAVFKHIVRDTAFPQHECHCVGGRDAPRTSDAQCGNTKLQLDCMSVLQCSQPMIDTLVRQLAEAWCKLDNTSVALISEC